MDVSRRIPATRFVSLVKDLREKVLALPDEFNETGLMSRAAPSTHHWFPFEGIVNPGVKE
jgi:hypothetical protein